MNPSVSHQEQCPGCGVILSRYALSCPGCFRLVHSGQLERIAEQARAAALAQHNTEELRLWRSALDLLPREPNIDLMLVDFAMPGMSGAEVARRARSTRPSLTTLFITGFADRAALAGVGENRIIGKPFRHEDLAQKIRAALSESETAQRAASPNASFASN